MFIDTSYFQRKLSLPQRGDSLGESELIGFINDYEPELLKKALGLDLYNAFISGLQQPVIESRWLAILNGAQFEWKGMAREWIGFLPLSAGSTIEVLDINQITLEAGGIGPNDPAPGFIFTLPSDFVGVPISIELRGTGTLKPGTEYTILNDTVTLLNGIELNEGSVLFIKKGTGLTIGTNSTIKKSPIANYVYYQFMEDNNQVTDNLGVIIANKDNNDRVSPEDKMLDAWNRMVDMLRDLLAYLTLNKTLYPEWKTGNSWPCYTNYWDWYDWSRYPDEVFKKKNRYDF